MNVIMLVCEEVIEVCKKAQHPMTCRTIAKKVGVTRKVARASLYHARKYIDDSLVVIERNFGTFGDKKPIWLYNPKKLDESFSN